MAFFLLLFSCWGLVGYGPSLFMMVIVGYGLSLFMLVIVGYGPSLFILGIVGYGMLGSSRLWFLFMLGSSRLWLSLIHI